MGPYTHTKNKTLEVDSLPKILDRTCTIMNIFLTS